MTRRRAAALRPSGIRPVRPLARVAGCLAGFAGWEAVGHYGGAGWVQALGDVVGAALVVGLVGPAFACARSRIAVTGAPADAVAGDDVVLSVEAGAPIVARLLSPPGPEAGIGPAGGQLVATPEYRGVYREVLVELKSASPFGILWWRRRVAVPLPRELVVSPRLGPPVEPQGSEDDHPGEGRRRTRADVGEPWSVRAYRSGDHRRSVHWPATAHSGVLAVKEMEAPRTEPVAVAVRLPADPDAAERLAERALGSVAALIIQGVAVVLATTEATGPRAAAVGGVVEAGRRLASAVADPSSAPGLVVQRGADPLAVETISANGAGREDAAASAPRSRQGFVERVRRANAPGPPEHSVPLRVACAGAVLCGIAAVWSQGELATSGALLSGVLLVLGMAVSYRLRERPPAWMKLILAFGALATFAWFFHGLAGQQTANVGTVEDPLAVLFVAIQVLHGFDVPARRDLAFSLAGSAILMAVAAAQATDMGFAAYVVVWMAFAFWALTRMWAAGAGARRVPIGAAAAALMATLALGTAALLALPAPTVAGRIDFPLNPGANVSLTAPLGLAGDGANASEPARPGTPAGRTGVGGFTGFSKRLDTALRGQLGDTVVMRVRAQVPSYWVGETFDRWDGQSWLTTAGAAKVLQSGSPFAVPPIGGTVVGGGSPAPSDLQTFYVVQSTPNLVFHADDAVDVWFPAHSIFLRDDGTIVSPIALGRGAIYTVRSYPNAAPPALLAADGAAEPAAGLDPRDVERYLQLPYPYPDVHGLAASITAGQGSTYGKVRALIAWISGHTKYSTSIPPLRRGEDAVDTFLFTTRTGFCEQISSALTVMLRTLGIPAREAAGFVPGPYNPITDLYDIKASDAHAWVEVWFPGYGWQSFDPTATVPLANPSPGTTTLHEVGHVLGRIPLLPVGGALVVAGVSSGLVSWRRRRPGAWEEQMARRLERAGRRAGRVRRPDETLSEYARVLDELHGEADLPRRSFAELIEASAYGASDGGSDGATTHDAARALWRRLEWLRRPRSGAGSRTA